MGMMVRGIRIDKGERKWYSGREKNVVFFLLVPFSLDGVHERWKRVLKMQNWKEVVAGGR